MPDLQTKAIDPTPPTEHQIYTRSIAFAIEPNQEQSLTALRALVEMVLMECVVRKVAPHWFTDVVESASLLLTLLARIEAAVTVEQALKLAYPERIPDKLHGALQENLMPKIAQLRAKMSVFAGQMALMPDEGTTIN